MSDTRTPVVAISLSGSRRSFSLTVGRGGCCQRGRDAGPSAAPRVRGAPGPPCAGVYDPRDFSGKVRATHSQQGYWLCLLILTHTSPQARRAPPCDGPHEEVPTPLSRSARPRPCEGGSKPEGAPLPTTGPRLLRQRRRRLAPPRKEPALSTAALPDCEPDAGKKTGRKRTQPGPGRLRGALGFPTPLFPRVLLSKTGRLVDMTNRRGEAFTRHPQTAQDKPTLGPAQWMPPCLEPELPTMTPCPLSQRPRLLPRWSGAEGVHAGLSPHQAGVPPHDPPLWLTRADRGPRGRGPSRRPRAAENGRRAPKHSLAPPDSRRRRRRGLVRQRQDFPPAT